MRTAQEIFDTIVSHLRKQGERATVKGGDTCRYRSYDGKKCAVGCLIPDDTYSKDYEGNDIRHLLERNILPSDLQEEFTAHISMLSFFQIIHDVNPIQTWEDDFKAYADHYGLIYNPKDK